MRIHRALSWLERAEKSDADLDAQFIFQWIAFNAAYANDVDKEYRLREHQLFDGFIGKLAELDDEKLLTSIVWNEFTGSIRLLLDNRYVFQPFWDYQKQVIDEQTWKNRFVEAKS